MQHINFYYIYKNIYIIIIINNIKIEQNKKLLQFRLIIDSDYKNEQNKTEFEK